MSSQLATAPTQYAIKKRKRPQPRQKNAGTDAVVKSNPSKRHRDRLNTELERLSQLIPLPQDVVNKLDKLSILRLSVAYLRNKSYSQHMHLESKKESTAILPSNRSQGLPTPEISESELAMQALDGFIIVVTQDFNVFYITTSVQDCLGFPQSDVIYQSMLELIHAEDRKVFMKQMLLNPMGPGGEKAPEDGDPPEKPDYLKHGLTPEVVRQLSRDGHLHRSFICRLRCLHDTSSGFLALHFTGHLGLVPGQNRREKDGTQLPPELGLFLLASPLQTPSILEIRTKNYIFRTRHKLDYTPLGIDQKGRIVLGYTEQELRQQSGYQFIHSADMMHCADAHTKLMKHGQSGLTVFRLLHRANRWQWVTASARLIFNKGIPDYIISTHRPITEQEGEEHLKKRSNAFRFDFTGHASLYASVNPIGAGAPPSGGPSEPNSFETKRPRIGGEEVDPATLYGAQSFQSMGNYPEGLPNLEPRHDPLLQPQVEVVKAENSPYSSDGGYFHSSPGTASSHSPASHGHNGHSSDSGFSDSEHQPSPGYNRILENLMETPFPAIPEIDTSKYNTPELTDQHVDYQQNGFNSHDEVSSNAWNQQIHPTYATNSNVPQQQMPQQQMPQQQMIQQRMPQNWGKPMPQAVNNVTHANHGLKNGYHHQQQATAYGPQHTQQANPSIARPQHYQPYTQQEHVGQYPRHQTQINPPMNQQYQGQPISNLPSGSVTRNFVEQIHHSGGQSGFLPQPVTALPRENVSVLNSVEISSRIATDPSLHQQRELEDIVSMLGPQDPNVSAEQFQISLECQEHTVQFDLDKIATEFQTSNPMGVIQDYVKKNPNQALALATGNMPEMKPVGGNGLTDRFVFQQQPPQMHPNHVMGNGKINQGYPPTQKLSHNYPVNPVNNLDVKRELQPGDLDFDIEEFLQFDIPNIEG